MQFLDFSPVAMAAIYSQMKYVSENGEIQADAVRHMIYDSVRRLNRLHSKKYGKMVICFDGSNNWRKTEFELYKAKRKIDREAVADVIDWDAFWGVFGEVKESMKENLPYICLEIEGAEADDVIGTLARYEFEINPKQKNIILSTDHDFIQCQKYPNVCQYSPRFNKMVFDKDPNLALYTKFVKGDKKDGVPNIKSADDSIITSTRQTPISAKFLASVLACDNDVELLSNLLTEEQYDRYKRNVKLLDLNASPLEVQQIIISEYDKKIVNGSMVKLMSYFGKNNMPNLNERISDF